MKAILQKEWHGYFSTVTGYLFTAFLMLFAGIFFSVLCLTGGLPSFEYVLSNMTFVFVIVTPILTLRGISEERRQKTDRLLYALPIGLTRVVLGKYAALLGVLAVPTALMGLYPLVLSGFGTVNLGAAYGSLLAFFLLGAALLSIGLYLSCLSDSPVACAAICFAVVLVNYFLSTLALYLPGTAEASFWLFLALCLLFALIVLRMTSAVWPAVAALAVSGGAVLAVWRVNSEAFAGAFPALLEKLSLFEAFQSFVGGEMDLAALFFYISVSVVFVVLTVQSMEKRRWSE